MKPLNQMFKSSLSFEFDSSVNETSKWMKLLLLLSEWMESDEFLKNQIEPKTLFSGFLGISLD